MSLEHSPARQKVTRAAFTIDEFCEAHRISRGALYGMWRAGTGPKFMLVGEADGKRIITNEAAAEWRRERQAATQASALPIRHPEGDEEAACNGRAGKGEVAHNMRLFP